MRDAWVNELYVFELKRKKERRAETRVTTIYISVVSKSSADAEDRLGARTGACSSVFFSVWCRTRNRQSGFPPGSAFIEYKVSKSMTGMDTVCIIYFHTDTHIQRWKMHWYAPSTMFTYRIIQKQLRVTLNAFNHVFLKLHLKRFLCPSFCNSGCPSNSAYVFWSSE